MALEYSFSPTLLLEAGPALLLAFALHGVAALAIGSCYAELASAMPRAGGLYYWIKQGIGPITGFFSGWINFYANTIAAALYAQAFGAFANALAESMMQSPPAPSSVLSTLAGIAVITIITIVEFHDC